MLQYSVCRVGVLQAFLVSAFVMIAEENVEGNILV